MTSTGRPGAPGRWSWRLAFALFLFALGLRCGALALWIHQGRGEHIAADAHDYLELARSVAAGRGFTLGGEPTARRPPLYPLLLAPLVVTLPVPLAIQLAQILIGAASCLVLASVGRALDGPATGWIAGWLMAIHYYSVRQPISVLPECLFVFLLLVGQRLWLRAHDERRWWWLGAAGAVTAAAALTKDVLTPFLALLVLWPLFWRDGLGRGLGRALVVLAGVAMVAAPWAVRNARQTASGAMAMTPMAGHMLYIANNPTTTGGRTGGEWEIWVDVRWEPDPDRPPMWTAEADRYLAGKALAFIRANPGRFVRLMATKLANMWRPWQADSAPASKWAMGSTYLTVMVFALPGLVWLAGQWRRLLPFYALIAYTVALHAVLIAQIRYRYPVMPVLMLFAAATLTRLWRRWREGRAHVPPRT